MKFFKNEILILFYYNLSNVLSMNGLNLKILFDQILSDKFEINLCLQNQTIFRNNNVLLQESISWTRNIEKCSQISNGENIQITILSFISISEFLHGLNMLSKSFQNFQNNSDETLNWTPFYLFLWQENIFSSQNIEQILLQNLQSLQFPLDSDLYICTISPDTLKISKIIEIFYVKNKLAVILQNVQNVGDGNLVYKLRQKVSRRRNFQKDSLAITGPDDPNYIHILRFEKSNNSNEPLEIKSGTSATFIWNLQQAMNFSYTVLEGDWITSITILNNMTGIAKQLKERVADVSIAPSNLSPLRIAHFLYLQPNVKLDVLVLFLDPSLDRIKDLFLVPFDRHLWACLFVTWILVVFSMNLVHFIKYNFEDLDPDDSKIREDAFLWAVGASCQQGWYMCPNSISMRIIFLSGSLTGLLCFIAFSASIVSILSVKFKPYKEISDFPNRTVQYYSNEEYTLHEFIGDFKYDSYDQSKPFEIPINESISLIREPGNLLLSESESFYYAARHIYPDSVICREITNIQLFKSPVKASIVLRKGSPLREFFNYWIIMLTERGITNRLQLIYNRLTKVGCIESEKASKRRLGAKDVFTAYFILISGFILSSLSLLVEISIYKYKTVKLFRM